MSSLHKRLVHRSAEGCCICRAKSSSSRFTASGKYEQFFPRCFQLGEAESRGGDICNACVLLVKRFKKLPLDTAQHWAHVVDARCESWSGLFVSCFYSAFMNKKYKWGEYISLCISNLDHDFRAGPGVKNFVRERRRESCRERGLASKRKSLFTKKIRQENSGQLKNLIQMIIFSTRFSAIYTDKMYFQLDQRCQISLISACGSRKKFVAEPFL